MAENIVTWQDYYNLHFKVKDNPKKFVGKIYDDSGKFRKSCVIPTDYYPLNSNEFNVFYKMNCAEMVDREILQIFDSVEYKAGFCYTMGDELVEKLRANGYEAKLWIGWLFCGNQFPVHHCWVTVGNSLLDLQDHFHVMFELNEDNFIGKNQQEVRELIADFIVEVKKHKIANSKRCAPVGIPSDMLYYVGCEALNGEIGKAIYNELVDRYPNHECNKNTYINGTTLGQRVLYKKLDEEGLL